MSVRPGGRDRFFLYPRPTEGPNVPYKNDWKSNPRIEGWFIVIAAFVMEWVLLIRKMVWKNTGFNAARNIRKYIEHTEPRFDPAVFPLNDDTNEDDNDIDSSLDLQQVPPPVAHNSKYSAMHYRALYLSGEITPLDVVKAILPLIRRDTSPPGEYSVIWLSVKPDLVLKAAEASTLRYKQGRSLGPLDGVPTGVKDEFDMDGYITTLGSANDYTGHETHDGSSIDTWCVRKIQDTGAIILGKLSMHEFGMDTSGANIFFGTPLNPYNPQYYPGGSSSGPAVAIACGLIPLALGSDGGGSIRIPSSFCSIFGLKTTHDRLSFFPGQNHSKTCGVNGPMAADMHSLASLYRVVSVPHPTSHFPAPSQRSGILPSGKNSHCKLIGIPEAWFSRAEAGVQALCRGMVAKLVAEKGYKVVNITIPFLPEGQMSHALTILTDAATLLPDSLGISSANRILLSLGGVTPATDYLLAQKLRGVLMQHLAWLWQTHPGMVIVTPTTACAGWRIKTAGELQYGVSDGDKTLKTMEYVWLGNFCGVPSISVPAGYVVPEGRENAGDVADMDVAGKVPVGLMATGEWASEEALMQFGLDAEALGASGQSRPPNWVDVIELARQQNKVGNSI